MRVALSEEAHVEWDKQNEQCIQMLYKQIDDMIEEFQVFAYRVQELHIFIKQVGYSLWWISTELV